jgi:hypothetical protein
MKQRPSFIGLRIPPDLLAAVRQRAAADDRTVSAYLRRLISHAVNADARG